jgi:hypothetical protein
MLFACGGPVFLGLTITAGLRGWLSWRTLFLAPSCWLAIWVYLERPGGIWLEMHKKTAEAFLFVPMGAYYVQRSDPRPAGGSTFSVSFYTKMELEDLAAYYRKKATEAGFVLAGYREGDPPRHSEYYWPNREMYYRDQDGVTCRALLFANPPYHPHERWVELQCYFPHSFLNPPDPPL